MIGKCNSCQQEKELAQYSKMSGGKVYNRPFCGDCYLELRRPYMRKYHADNAEILKERYRGRYKKNKPAMNAAMRRHYRKLRDTVMQHYGSECRCCGEQELRFLEIDHINNDGAKHRKEIGVGHILYRWLIDQGFPGDFQILCSNCNAGKHRNGGICPHKDHKKIATFQPSNWLI